ncbi:MAG: hypothetical protein C0599_06025 [Salinivirgaceae bacterium]|nr:MAG: hypothetical protein C0599_06025 [Salinivirgaceae bacterium]
MKKTKVIGVGFHKTGTSTLDTVLKHLGYKVLGAKTELAENLLNNDLDSVLKMTKKYDAYQDNPWPLLYKEFDKLYPNSKFILTLRDSEKWIKSLVNHFGENHTEMRKWIYGVGHPKGNEEIYLARYKKHNEEVMEYFKDRKEDLLVVNWENGDEWEPICNFLGIPVPNEPFPHANKGNYTEGMDKKKVSKHSNIFKSIFKR